MSEIAAKIELPPPFPDHTQLPESDGTFVKNFQEHPLEPNDRGHYPIVPLGVELGLWQGNYQNQNQLWLRWWDRDGNLLLTGWEQTELERLRVEQERDRADRAESELEQERDKAARLAERLRAAGLDPNV